MGACPRPPRSLPLLIETTRAIGAGWQARIIWLGKEVTRQRPTTLPELQAAIQVAASAIPMDAPGKAIDSTPKRIALCIENDGGFF